MPCSPEVLVEGPSDLTDLLPMLAHRDMVPPVALLAYPTGEPERSLFWPFAIFSPEYQAICWAYQRGVPVRFIDLPVYWRLQEETHDPVDEDRPVSMPDSEQPDAPHLDNTPLDSGRKIEGSRQPHPLTAYPRLLSETRLVFWLTQRVTKTARVGGKM